MRERQIQDLAALEAALTGERYLLFKHSLSCGISSNAFREYEAFLERNPGTPTGWIEVRAQRTLSDAIAARTDVRHESPQALWIRQGKVAWHASHFEITSKELTRALGA